MPARKFPISSSRSPIEPNSSSPARAMALSVLIECQHSDDSLEALMDRALRPAALDQRDRASAVEIAFGVLRRLGTIDWRLGPVLNKPPARLPGGGPIVLRSDTSQ